MQITRNSTAPAPPRPASMEAGAHVGFRGGAHVGVYVHFPWCLAKCPYCDFTSFAAKRSEIPHRAYADAVLAELAARRAEVGRARPAIVRTVFFGGGTPSLWEPDELARVLAGIRSTLPWADDVEVTVECNPTSLDEARARALRDGGVTRLSVGVQSLDGDRLSFLGRLHDAPGGLRAVRDALASGLRVSGDLLFGVAGGKLQSAADAAREVREVAEAGVTHVSAYGLTIEPATRFGDLHRKGRLPVVGDDAMADAFVAVEAALESLGFEHYEISNYAKPGHEARHNLGYWRGHDYLGLGCAAVGTLGGEGREARRYRNARDPAKYMRAAAGGAPAEVEVEVLDPETRLRERIMLGLRLAEGVDLAEAGRQLGLEALTPERRRAVDGLVARGLLEMDGDRVRVPKRARVMTDGVAAELF